MGTDRFKSIHQWLTGAIDRAEGAAVASWDPIEGAIPPDPPNAPWNASNMPTPADIIRSCRNVWKLRAGPLAEHAQALFDRAGPWLDHWRANRSAAETLSLAGITVDDPGPGDAPDVTPETAMLAICAARQAIAKRDPVMWYIALQLANEARGPIGESRVGTLVVQIDVLTGEASAKQARREARDAAVLKKAAELLASGTKPHELARELASMNFPDARSGQERKLDARTIRGILKGRV